MTKNLYIFAGVNGAGKSTLYNSNIKMKDIKDSIRINTDEIVSSFGDWKNSVDQIKAGKIAINLRNQCFKEGKSFNEETTLTGKTILKTIEKAKELGYKIHLYYVGVDNPEIAKKRVKNRVIKGGHNIPEEIIEKRYYESIQNLEKIISKCDSARIYDNTDVYKEIFYSKNDKIIKVNEEQPKWARKAIDEKINSINKNLLKESKKEIKKTNPLVERVLEERKNENNSNRRLKK